MSHNLVINSVGLRTSASYIVEVFKTQRLADIQVMMFTYSHNNQYRQRAYIQVLEWFNTPASVNLQCKLNSSGSAEARVMHCDPYWWIVENLTVVTPLFGYNPTALYSHNYISTEDSTDEPLADDLDAARIYSMNNDNDTTTHSEEFESFMKELLVLLQNDQKNLQDTDDDKHNEETFQNCEFDYCFNYNFDALNNQLMFHVY